MNLEKENYVVSNSVHELHIFVCGLILLKTILSDIRKYENIMCINPASFNSESFRNFESSKLQ